MSEIFINNWILVHSYINMYGTIGTTLALTGLMMGMEEEKMLP